MTTAAIRKADAEYYLYLAQQAGNKYSHEGLTAVWKQIKSVLPRHRMKQAQAQQDFGDELLQHFAHLEAGTVTNHAVSCQQCVERNNSDLADAPRHRQIDLADLPTLVEVEDLCLKQRPNRAPGLDFIPPEVCRFAAKAIAPFLHNVILKSFIRGELNPTDTRVGSFVPSGSKSSHGESPAPTEASFWQKCTARSYMHGLGNAYSQHWCTDVPRDKSEAFLHNKQPRPSRS